MSDGCDQCFLRNNLDSIEKHYKDAIENHGAKPEDIVFILNAEAKDTDSQPSDALDANSFLRNKFPHVDIKFDDDFEGMEKSVVFNMTNGSIGSKPSIIPLSLTRANNHLVIFIQDFRDIFQDASKMNLVKTDQKNISPTLETNPHKGQMAPGVREASEILASLSTNISLDSVEKLVKEWGVEDLYQQLIQQNKTRWQMIKILTQQLFKTQTTLTMSQFMDSLATASMMNAATRVPLTRSLTLRDVVAEQIKLNIEYITDDLKGRITARNLTDNEQIELAISLGQGNLFNLLTRPQDPNTLAISDHNALATCVDTWRSQATQMTSTEEVINCLVKAGLSKIAVQIKQKLENQTGNNDIASFANITLQEQIETTVFDVFLPIVCIMFTTIFLILLYSNYMHTQFMILLVAHWVPGAVFFSIHLYYNQSFYGPILSRFHMILLLLFQLIGSTVLHIHYIMQRVSSTGGAVERYKMKKVIQLAESSMLMNNFTSMTTVIYALQMVNEGKVSLSEPALFSFFTLAAGSHFLKLVINIVKKKTSEEDTSISGLKIYPIISSLLVKTVAVLFMLSSNTNYAPLCCCIAMVLAFVFNFWIEKKLVNTETEEPEVNMTWLRATHSLIFPLAPEQKSRKAYLGASLQLVVGDMSAVAVGFTVTSLAGLVKGLFLTPNMGMALGVTSIGLTLVACNALYVSHALKPSSLSRANEDIEQSCDEATETT